MSTLVVAETVSLAITASRQLSEALFNPRSGLFPVVLPIAVKKHMPLDDIYYHSASP